MEEPAAPVAPSATARVPTQYATDCRKLAAESFKCLEATEGDRQLCDPHFKAYKACLKDEAERSQDVGTQVNRLRDQRSPKELSSLFPFFLS